MATLHAHLTALGSHDRLSFRPDCPICGTRLQGASPTTALIPARVKGGIAACTVAVATIAPAGMLQPASGIAASGASGGASKASADGDDLPDTPPPGGNEPEVKTPGPGPASGSATAEPTDDAGSDAAAGGESARKGDRRKEGDRPAQQRPRRRAPRPRRFPQRRPLGPRLRRRFPCPQRRSLRQSLLRRRPRSCPALLQSPTRQLSIGRLRGRRLQTPGTPRPRLRRRPRRPRCRPRPRPWPRPILSPQRLPKSHPPRPRRLGQLDLRQECTPSALASPCGRSLAIAWAAARAIPTSHARFTASGRSTPRKSARVSQT